MSTNRIIELCLVFLVSILSFSVGTFVGKKYSDNQHKLALLDPNAKPAQDTTSETEHTSATIEPTKEGATSSTEGMTPEESKLKAAITNSTPITDTDVAKMAEEFSDDDTDVKESANVVKTIDEDGTIIDEIKKPAIAKTTKPGKKENLARSVATISEKAKNTLTDATGKAQYTVQVGAFATTAEADKVSNSLQARGYKATHTEATVNGKKWYRVQVGLFNSLDDAQVYKKELVEKNHLSSAMIQRLTQ